MGVKVNISLCIVDGSRAIVKELSGKLPPLNNAIPARIKGNRETLCHPLNLLTDVAETLSGCPC